MTAGTVQASRAHQRCRRPAAPSYFVKASSSVAASGGTIERPPGTELLALEVDAPTTAGPSAQLRQRGLNDIVGDADGVIVIPPALAEEVADATLGQEGEDAWIAEPVRQGHPAGGLFPVNAAWRARYEARDVR